MTFYEFFVSLDLSQREDSSGKLAASWWGRSVCPKGGTSQGVLQGYAGFPNVGLPPLDSSLAS